MIFSGSNPETGFTFNAVPVKTLARYAILLPSRDHTPTTSSDGSKVKRILVVAPAIQTSTLLAFGSLMSTAIRVPSGEMVGLEMTAEVPTRLSPFPLRSTHVSTDKVAPACVL